MREWDNSRAPQLGDRRISMGCVTLIMFFTWFGAVIAYGIVKGITS